MSEFLQGVGALTLIVVGGAWLMRWCQEREQSRSLQARLKYLQQRRLSHPEEAEAISKEFHELLTPKPRARLF